jgi:hypothetical protein
VGPSPASVASCPSSHGHDYDNAYVRDFFFLCSTIGVLHHYDPIWSDNNYWTSWVYGTNVVYSPSNPEVITHSVYFTLK